MSRTITVIIQIGLMQLLLVIYSYAQANIEHPQEKYIPYLDKIEERVISLLPKNNSGQSIIKSKIHNAKQIYQIGQKEGPSYQIIGRITSIVTDQENNIYLLDSRKNTVLVYNSIGKYLYQFGRGGRGPGEFQSPIDMAIDEEGNIWFLSGLNSEHNSNIVKNPQVQLLYSDPSGMEFISIYGMASVITDNAKLKNLYTNVDDAWFEGEDDPNLTALKITPKEAYYWDTKQNKYVSLFKMGLAAASGNKADVGEKGKLNL
jgi:general stress protein 26